MITIPLFSLFVVVLIPLSVLFSGFSSIFSLICIIFSVLVLIIAWIWFNVSIIIIQWRIFERLKYSGALVLTQLIPLLGFFIFGIIWLVVAFSSKKN
jgi:hypothetical protein